MNSTRLQNAGFLQDSGRFREALAEYESMARETRDPSERVMLELNAIGCLLFLGEVDPARIRLSEIAPRIQAEHQLSFDLSNLDLLIARGEFPTALKKTEQMARQCAELVEQPSFRFLAEALKRRRATIWYYLGRWQEAADGLSESLSFDLPVYERAETLLNLGFCQCALKKYKGAKENLLESIRLGLDQSSKAVAYHTLGVVYFDLEAFAYAKESFEKCLETADPSYIKRWRAYEWLRDTCRRLGLMSEAERYAGLARQTR